MAKENMMWTTGEYEIRSYIFGIENILLVITSTH